MCVKHVTMNLSHNVVLFQDFSSTGHHKSVQK